MNPVILVDTSIWVDHFRNGHATLVQLLELGSVLGHPWIVGELALGHLARRHEVLRLLSSLPGATVAAPAEVLTFIERHEMHGLGIGYVDAQLLASTRLTPGTTLWTNDKRLAAASSRLHLAADPQAR